LGSLAQEGFRFDLIYADPPFETSDFHALLEGIAAAKLLHPEGVLVVEHPARLELPPQTGGVLRHVDRRKYADVALAFFRPISKA
jgi:16S rRNA G966 N2-methylase RsmD